MDRVVTSLIGGLSLGGTLSLVALGLVLAFRATHTFNFAHGEFMLVPAFFVARWQSSGAVPLWLAIPAALATGTAIAVAFFLVVLKRLVGAPVFIPVIATLGLSSIIEGFVAIYFGYNQYSLNLGFLPGGVVDVAGARLSRANLVLLLFSLVLALAVASWLKFTHTGTKIRAAGQNPVLASQGGISVTVLYAASWAIAGALAGTAGITYAAQNVVSPSLANVALVAFPAMLLGGLDSIAGALVGGVAVGVLQGFVATYWDGQLVDVVTYVVLLLVLMVLPSGIFGTRQVTRL